MPLKMQPKQKHPENPPAAASSSSESEEEHQTPSLLLKKPVPVEEASSDDDEEASSEEAEEEGDEEEVAQPGSNPTANTTNPNPEENTTNPNPEEDSEEADEEGDEEEVAQPKSLVAHPGSQASPSGTPAKSAAKRPAEESGDPNPAKKMKGVIVGSEQEKSLKPFQKVWSNEDEITIVKGLADFISRSGNDPTKYADGFYDSVKKSLLKADTNPSQLKEKVRRLKMKFQTHAGKGEDPNFTKPHDHNLFVLSKMVWGKKGGNEADRKPKSNSKKSKPDTSQVDSADSSLLLREMFRVSGPSEDVVKEGLALIGREELEELEGKWKKLKVAELELFAELYRLASEALKSRR